MKLTYISYGVKVTCTIIDECPRFYFGDDDAA